MLEGKLADWGGCEVPKQVGSRTTAAAHEQI